MKIKYLFLLSVLCLAYSCDNNDDYEVVQVATPVLMSKAEFRSSVEVSVPQPVKSVGKIYAYNNLIFIGDADGIHIIDNSNPSSPVNTKFLKIPSNKDISVKNDYLYADSATDLLVFDISNVNAGIPLVERLEDVFMTYDYGIPVEAESVNYNDYDYENDIIVGWTLAPEKRKKLKGEVLVDVGFDGTMNFAESVTGVGGSLARFQIVSDYLYTVGNYEMTIFNIQDLDAPVLVNTEYAGWNIETMFQADSFLYLGSTNGMYIYSLENPTNPEFVSEFLHWESCDPVVVDGDYAYLTLRGGNFCGQLESVLEVIDISDKSLPTLAKRYALENPYGLGIKNNTLFVCDGTAGLKLFNKENPLNLSLVNHIQDIQSKDVIPLQNSLLMIGGSTLYQYSYLDNDVELISAFSLN